MGNTMDTPKRWIKLGTLSRNHAVVPTLHRKEKYRAAVSLAVLCVTSGLRTIGNTGRPTSVYFVRQNLGARVPECPRSSCRTAWTRFELKQPPLSQSLDTRPVPVQ